MKEKHKHVFRKRFSFEKYGRGKERSKKELKLTFFEKGKEKRRSFQKEQDYVSVRM